MIETLRFVRGAVAKKDYQPALTHFQIRNGRITGFNGTIALSSPIGIDIDAVPKAEPFLRAIENCTVEPTVIHKTEAGRLGLRSGRFRAFVDCLDDDAHELFDNVKPEGEGNTRLVIGETGVIEGSCEAHVVELHGTVKGDITGRVRVVLGPRARVEGNLHYGAVEMAAGAAIKGKMVKL